MQTTMERRPTGGQRDSAFPRAATTQELRDFVRGRGPQELQLRAVEIRQQEAKDLASGGFWIAVDGTSARELFSQATMASPIRRVAQIRETTTSADAPLPTVGRVAGRRLAESAALTQTDLTAGRRVSHASIYVSDSMIFSRQLVQDAEALLNQILEEAGVRIGLALDVDLTLGTGVDQPEGVVHGALLGVTAVATGAVSRADLLDLEASLPAVFRYAPGTRLMMHPDTLTELKSIVDGAGRPVLWEPLPDDPAGTIIGYRVSVNDNMPLMAAATRPIVLADFSQYLVRDVRGGVRLQRLDELYAANLQVGFFALSYHDGMWVHAGNVHPARALQMAP